MQLRSGETSRSEGRSPWRNAPWLLGLFAALGVFGVGIGLFRDAEYLADDYGLVAGVWGGGSFADGFRAWWDGHVVPNPSGSWPKFYRPVWHASFLLDAHLFGRSAWLSTLLGWSMHCAAALCLGSIVAQRSGRRWAIGLAVVLALLPAAALEAPLWIAARGSVGATLCLLIAVRLTLGDGPLSYGRRAAIGGAVLVAAAWHESGVMVGPVLSWVLWLTRRGDRPLVRGAQAGLPLLVSGAWIVWRRCAIGCWVGGYGPTHGTTAAGLMDVVWTTGSAVGAVAMPGAGTLAGPVSIGAGVVALGVFGWVQRGAGRTGDLGAAWLCRVALGMSVLCLLPFKGTVFRDVGMEGGRYLYPVHMAYVLGIVGVVSWLSSRAFRRPLGLLPAALVLGATGWSTAVGVAHHRRATAVMRQVLAGIDALPADTTVCVFDLPDAVEGWVVSRNAFPWALRAPFRDRSQVATATERELADGTLTMLTTKVPEIPGLPVHAWRGPTRGIEPATWPTACVWRGQATRDPQGRLSCGGVRITGDAAASAALVSEQWYELQVTGAGAANVTTLELQAAAPWQPLLHIEAGHLRYRGQPGDALVLLYGSQPCVVGMGRAGSLAIQRPLAMPLGGADAAGTFAIDLPEPLRSATCLQAMVLRGPGFLLGEIHRAAAAK